MRKTTKKVTAIIAVTLGIIMGVQSPLTSLSNGFATEKKAQAATKKQEDKANAKYVKEVRMYSGGSKAEAKAWFEKNGYTSLEQDINAGTGKKQAYLGYKTTNKEEEAITDMSLLQMNDGFQYVDYNEMVEKNSNRIRTLASELRSACIELKERKNSPDENVSRPAKVAIKTLNAMVVEADDGKTYDLGDYLMDVDSSDNSQRKISDYIELITVCSTDVVSLIYNQLAFGTSGDASGEGTWLDKMSELGTENIPEYTLQYDYLLDKCKTIQPVLKQFSTKYHQAEARKKKNNGEIYASKETQKLLKDGADLDSKKVQERMDEMMDDTEESHDDDALYIGTYDILKKYKFGNTNIGDFLIKAGDGNISAKKLMPFVYSLTSGQYAAFRMAGLFAIVFTAEGHDSEVCNKAEKQVETTIQKLKKLNDGEKLSVWLGVNRNVYNGKVAVTKRSFRRSTASNQMSLLAKSTTDLTEIKKTMETINIVSLSISAASSLVSIGLMIAGIGFVSMFKVAAGLFIGLYAGLGAVAITLGVLATIGVVLFVAAIVVSIVYLCYYIYQECVESDDEKAYENPEYTEVPLEIYDFVEKNYDEEESEFRTEKDDEDSLFVKYNVVMDQSDKPGDANTWQGKEWIALYTTATADIGAPILVSDMAQAFTFNNDNTAIPSGYAPVRFFGEVAAGNTNRSAYKEADCSPIFIYYFNNTETKQEPAESEPTPEPSDIQAPKKTKYIGDIKVFTEQNKESEMCAQKARAGGYILIEKNLTPKSDTCSYLGYKTTSNINYAVTDIRLAVSTDDKYDYGEMKNKAGAYSSAGYAKCGTLGDTLSLYYTISTCMGSAIKEGDLVVLDGKEQAEEGWEPVNLFSGGNAFNTAKASFVNSNAEQEFSKITEENSRFIYFKPTEMYTAKNSKKYLSGLMFVTVFNKAENKDSQLKTLMETYGLTDISTLDANNKQTFEINDVGTVSKSIYSGYSVDTRLCYSTTYNPKRAIYDIKRYQMGSFYAKQCFSNMTCDGLCYSACAGVIRTPKDYNKEGCDAHRSNEKEVAWEIIRSDNSYSPYYTDSESYFKSEYVPEDLYVSGVNHEKNPLTPGDLKVSKSANKIEGYLTVQNMDNLYSDTPVDITSSKKGKVYLFIPGKKKEKARYISSITVIKNETDDLALDIAKSNVIAMKDSDILNMDLLDANLKGIRFSDGSYKSYVIGCDDIGKDGSYKGHKQRIACIAVTRTDNPNKAITNIRYVDKEKGDKNEVLEAKDSSGFKHNYQRAGDKGSGYVDGASGKYYLFYTHYTGAGAPVTDISFSSKACESGKLTVANFSDGQITNRLKCDGQKEDKYLHLGTEYYDEKKKETVHDPYISKVESFAADSKEEAVKKANAQGYPYVVDMDMNYHTDGKKVYLGYRRTSDSVAAIRDMFITYGSDRKESMVGGSYTEEHEISYKKYDEEGDPIVDEDGDPIIFYRTEAKTYNVNYVSTSTDLNEGSNGGKIYLYYTYEDMMGDTIGDLYGWAVGSNTLPPKEYRGYFVRKNGAASSDNISASKGNLNEGVICRNGSTLNEGRCYLLYNRVYVGEDKNTNNIDGANWDKRINEFMNYGSLRLTDPRSKAS